MMENAQAGPVETGERLIAKIAAYDGVREGLCVAFSGGVDSSVALTAAVRAAQAGQTVYAVYFSTLLHPTGEKEEARALAERAGASFHLIEIDELAQAGIEWNPPDRCYRCKRLLFTLLRRFAGERGIRAVLDGTNADDEREYRPGLRALRELEIHSPLLELRMSKSAVRALAAAWGLQVAAKPSSPCLATRIEYNTRLLREELALVGRAEDALRERGFAAVRVRKHRGLARLEVPAADIPALTARREEIARLLREMGFTYVTLDLEGLCSGSMDRTLTLEEKNAALGLEEV